MDGHMKIDGDKVRALRDAKSWSQQHLARASGLSERTIQRVELESAGSAETRLALASALDVPVSELFVEPESSGALARTRRLPLCGWLGWLAGVGCTIAVVT